MVLELRFKFKNNCHWNDKMENVNIKHVLLK